MNTFSPIAISILGLNTNQPSNIKNIDKMGLMVYPNPAKELLNISTNSLNIEKVGLIDMTGKTVISQDSQSSSVSINISGLCKGIYTVLIQTAEGSVYQKITIE